MQQAILKTGLTAAILGLLAVPCMAQTSAKVMHLTSAQVTAKLQAAGYTKVHGIEKEGTHYDADAMKDGKAIHLHVDARTGDIMVANDENESEEKEAHEEHKEHHEP